MANVRLAPILRSSVGGSKQISAEGSTLNEVLTNLYQRHPSEELSKFVNVYVNDQDVRFLKKLATPVGPSDTITLLPAMAGGR